MGLNTKLAWVALPALAGCGMLSQVSSQGTGTNPGGKANLPWPKNETPFKVEKAYSWDAKLANPNDPEAGKNLPDYGSVSVVEVNNSINAVWNACKILKHIPGEKLKDTSGRIQSKVDGVISGLGYKPTLAHMLVLRAAGNDTFVMCNAAYGTPTKNGRHAGGVLSPSVEVTFIEGKDRQCQDIAQALLNLERIEDACVDITALTMALDAQAGIVTFSNDGFVRKPITAQVDPGSLPFGHMTISRLLPTVAGSKVDEDKWAQDHKRYVTMITGDPLHSLLGGDAKANLDSIQYMPNPHKVLVGAKGDDALVVYAACKFINGYALLFHVTGIPFGDRRQNGLFDVSAAAGLEEALSHLNSRIISGEQL